MQSGTQPWLPQHGLWLQCWLRYVPRKDEWRAALRWKDKTQHVLMILLSDINFSGWCQTRQLDGITTADHPSRPLGWSSVIGISWRNAGLPAAAEYNEFPGNSSRCGVMSFRRLSCPTLITCRGSIQKRTCKFPEIQLTVNRQCYLIID